MWPWILRIVLALAALLGAALIGVAIRMVGQAALQLTPFMQQAIAVFGSLASAVLVFCALMLVLNPPPHANAGK